MKAIALAVGLLSLQAISQPLNIAATNDSIVVNDSIAFSNSDIASMNFDKGIKAAADGDYQVAIGYFDAALLFDGSKAEAFYNRGLAKFYLNDLENAVQDFTKALTLGPSDTSALSQRGVAYAKLNDNVRALADFNELLRIHPTSGMGHYNKGVLYLTTGRTEEACTLLTEAEDLGYASAARVKATYCD